MDLALSGERTGNLSRGMPDLFTTEPGWFCFKALPKKEHIAAELLRREAGMEAFCPRLAYHKKTRRGKVRFVEPLFPGYVFLNTDLRTEYRRIRATKGVRDIVCFGPRVPGVPASFIAELRARLDAENVRELPDPALRPGKEVTVTDGPFKDWQAIIAGEVDSRQRVALLLEFLGRQLEVKVATKDLLIPQESPKERVWEE